MTADIERIRQMLKNARERGDFSDYEPGQVIFAFGRLLSEVDRLWTKYPTEADHTWRGSANDD